MAAAGCAAPGCAACDAQPAGVPAPCASPHPPLPLHQTLQNALPVPDKLWLSSEKLQPEGVYLLENGFEAFIYVGKAVAPQTCQDLFVCASGAGQDQGGRRECMHGGLGLRGLERRRRPAI